MNKSINFNAIVAMNNIDQGIGFKENLPWNIKEDNLLGKVFLKNHQFLNHVL